MTSYSSAIIISVICFTVSGCCLSAAAQHAPGKPVHLQVKRLNDSFIDVYHNTPADSGRQPLLLFCQGSGTDSNTEGVLQLLGMFSDKAVGVAIEKQGVQYGDDGSMVSDIYRRHNTVHNRLTDYLRVLQYLRSEASWWNGDVYVVGGSEGGLLAGLLASFYPRVKGVAILSYGGGLTFGEAWPMAVAAQQADSGNAELAARLAADTLAMALHDPVTYRSYSGMDNTFAWWASIQSLRLKNALLDVDVPIFLGQGGRDLMAPPQSARALRDAFAAHRKTNLYYREYADLDHGFSTGTGESKLVEVFLEAIRYILP